MVVLKYSSVKDIDAHTEVDGFKTWCNNKRDCLYKDKIRKYHGWMHLDNLKEGKTIQCGYHSGDCDSRTLYGVGGYRNVCPIGGCNGDFPAPAKLQISDFNFSDYQISKNSKVKKITVSFEHRMNGVSTVSGTPYYGSSNSPDFTSSAVKVYFTKDNEKVSKEFIFGNPNNKSDKKFTSVSCTFTDISINDILSNDFALNIEYNFNHNTNPGIIYLRWVSVNIDYDNAEIYMDGTNGSPTLYTSNDNNCITNIHQTIKAGYKNGNKIISPNDAPSVLGSKIKCIKKPNNVTVTEISSSNTAKIFNIVDKSNISGKKEIVYGLSNNTNQTFTLSYEAIKRNKPSYKIATKYKSYEDYNEKKSYIVFKNGCASSISIYIDSLNSTPLTLSVANQNSSTNLLNNTQIKKFHDKIKTLNCGKHTLYIKRGNESNAEIRENKVYIEISPMNFQFSVYTNETPDNQMIFNQSKDPVNRYSDIIIKRIDNEPIAKIPRILVSDETQPNSPIEDNYILNLEKQETRTWQIDKYYAGKYKIGLTPSLCKSKKQTFNVQINEYHKQNYDYLFTRGQDGTTFDFDYLVAWEADDLKEPLNIENIEFSNLRNDIKICSNSVEAGLSEIGLIELRVTNTREDKAIENLKIELNTLIENEEDILTNTTNEWISTDGIFNQFYNLFEEYNSSMKDNVEILNLTPDNDLYEEENVYISIKKIDAESTVRLYLPFRGLSEKTIFLQYLLLEKPMKINSLESCFSNINEEEREMIKITVNDSMLTNLEIFGNTDLLIIDDRYECPTECFTTVDTDENGQPIDNIESGGITYRITNIDTNNFFNQKSLITRIINDKELMPYGYIIDNQYYQLLDENNNILDVQEGRYLVDANGNIIYYQLTDENDEFIYDENGNTQDDLERPMYAPNKLKWVSNIETIKKPMINYNINCTVAFPESEELTYTIKTDKKGIANFFIPIPTSLNTSYTIEELLEEVLIFNFKGNGEYNPCILTKRNDVLYPETDQNKDETFMTYIDNFRKYKPGETANIPVSLIVRSKILQNYFIFNAELEDEGSFDEVTILYKICNINQNKGTFKTTFETNDEALIKNQISKNIYCGMDTDVKVSTKIEKKIVENNNLNIIDITVQNQEKENRDVEIQIDLTKHDSYLGKYDFLDINIEHGDYSIIKDSNEHYISWLIGKMNPFEKENAVIKIKAKEIGLSDIKINCYDYLHQKNQEPLIINNNNCPKCSEIKTKLADSKWTEIEGLMYKLFDDGKYRRRVGDEWIEYTGDS